MRIFYQTCVLLALSVSTILLAEGPSAISSLEQKIVSDKGQQRWYPLDELLKKLIKTDMGKAYDWMLQSSEWNTTPPTELQPSIYASMCHIYINRSEYILAQKHCSNAAASSSSDDTSPEVRVQVLKTMAYMQGELAAYDLAIEQLNKAINISETHHLGRHYELLTNLAIVLTEQGEYTEALRLGYKALQLAEQDPQAGRAMVTALGAIGRIYFSREDDLKALEFYNRAIEIGTHHTPPSDTSVSKLNKAIALVYLEQTNDAESILKQLIQETRDTNMRIFRAAERALADLYTTTGQYQAGQELATQSPLLHSSSPSQRLRSQIQAARSARLNNRLDLAGDYLQQAQQSLLDAPGPGDEAIVTKEQIEQYRANDNSQQALQSMQRLLDIRQAEFNQHAAEQIAKLEIAYQLNLQDQKIRLLQQDNQLKRIYAKQVDMLVLGTIIVSTLLLVAFLLYMQRQRAIHARQQERIENEKILRAEESANSIIRQQLIDINSSIQNNKKE